MPTFCTISLTDRPFFLKYITWWYMSLIKFAKGFFIVTFATNNFWSVAIDNKRSIRKVANTINCVWIVLVSPKCDLSHMYSYYQSPFSLSSVFDPFSFQQVVTLYSPVVISLIKRNNRGYHEFIFSDPVSYEFSRSVEMWGCRFYLHEGNLCPTYEDTIEETKRIIAIVFSSWWFPCQPALFLKEFSAFLLDSIAFSVGVYHRSWHSQKSLDPTCVRVSGDHPEWTRPGWSPSINWVLSVTLDRESRLRQSLPLPWSRVNSLPCSFLFHWELR